ncbi:homocysteine S-methyltransferase family protein [Oceanirhabdus sp. W0125-5]|uniref:homocysteine S-methyltransferase family protein n=1 Tax=Oceanirhabdus sp. W0125-5 TaxID=2999116 RepID=UPI0022F338F6|nr:homocysteine S-methyltransferase family protein [Oceanirhabdus sp. W0125-5]WBW99804.1 homocysteine S-methyltransferase family protein [Oceanirhabdus sp. W0125-5]
MKNHIDSIKLLFVMVLEIRKIMSNILDFIKNRVVFFDGAMGTEIDRRGLDISKGVMEYNINNRKLIKKIHEDYLDAGADIITANTLTANELYLKDSIYTSKEIIEEAINIAKESVEGMQNKFIAQVVGPAGYLIKDNEQDKEKILYDLYKNQVEIGENSNVDVILIETMYSLKEAEIAIKAVKENLNIPIFCTVVLNDKGETFDGKGVKEIVETLHRNGADALGINCTSVSDELMNAVEDLMKYSHIPVIVQPNLGIPKEVQGKKIYSVDINEYVKFMLELYNRGVKILGGCCGTTPESMGKLIEKLRS